MRIFRNVPFHGAVQLILMNCSREELCAFFGIFPIHEAVQLTLTSWNRGAVCAFFKIYRCMGRLSLF